MIRIILPGKVVPKARPRFSSRGHVHMPPKYAEWKQEAVITLRGLTHIVSSKVSLQITFVNALRGNADCDNAAGAIMDALVESEVLSGDSVATIPELIARSYKEKKPKIKPQTLIEISDNCEVNIDKIREFLV